MYIILLPESYVCNIAYFGITQCYCPSGIVTSKPYVHMIICVRLQQNLNHS